MQRHAVLYPDGSMNVLADNPRGLTGEEQARLEAWRGDGSVHVLVEITEVRFPDVESIKFSPEAYKLLTDLPVIVAWPPKPPKPTGGSPKRGTRSKRQVRP